MRGLIRFLFHGWTIIAVLAFTAMKLISNLPDKKESEWLEQIRPYVSLPEDTIRFLIEWRYLPIQLARDTNYSFVIQEKFKSNTGDTLILDDFLRHTFPQGLRPCTVYVHIKAGYQYAFLYIPMHVNHKNVWMLPSEAFKQETPKGLTYTCVFTDAARYWKQLNEDRWRNPKIWKIIGEREIKGLTPVIPPDIFNEPVYIEYGNP